MALGKTGRTKTRRRFPTAQGCSTLRTIVERLHAKGVEVYRVQDPAGLLTFERGLTKAIAEGLIVEPNCSAVVACHASAAGLAIVVGRTLPAIEELVRKVEEQGACRPQCASQGLGRQGREGEGEGRKR